MPSQPVQLYDDEQQILKNVTLMACLNNANFLLDDNKLCIILSYFKILSVRYIVCFILSSSVQLLLGLQHDSSSLSAVIPSQKTTLT